jgi:hypothetical protein
MRRILLIVTLTLTALPALALTPQPGDLFIKRSSGTEISRVDPSTGQIELVSCWNPIFTAQPCDVVRGAGPADWFLRTGEPFVVGPDGWLYTTMDPLSGTVNQIFRIDPDTGNREQVTTFAESIGQEEFLVWPDDSFFSPPAVAALGGWGLAVLAIGIFVGVQLRTPAKP